MNKFFTGVFKYLEFPNALGVMNSFLARATVGQSSSRIHGGITLTPRGLTLSPRGLTLPPGR